MNRYRATEGYNKVINNRQFGGLPVSTFESSSGQRPFIPEGTLELTREYERTMEFTVGGVEFELHHAKGETDDHTWTWIPQHKMISAGDQFIWNFPNCGNPQKVQRYPLEWADSLRKMMAKERWSYLFQRMGCPLRGTHVLPLVWIQSRAPLNSWSKMSSTP